MLRYTLTCYWDIIKSIMSSTKTGFSKMQKHKIIRMKCKMIRFILSCIIVQNSSLMHWIG